MDLTSFMKTAIYKVFVIVTIAMMVFTTLGIQPSSASTLVPLLHPVVQLNAVNDSNGNFESLIGDNDESFDVSHIDNKTFVAAMKFNSIDTTKSIISANLILYVLNDNDNIAGLPTADLVTRVGSSNWINGSFPNELTGLSSEKESISRSMTGEPVKVSIDVKQLLESPSAIDGQQITFLLSSDSQNMYIVKSGNTITRDWDPYLQINYGDAQDIAPTLISTAPANNAQYVSVNSPLSLTFSANINAVEGRNIRIYDAGNDNLIDSIAATNTNVVTVNGSTVSIQLTNNLLKGKTYYVLMDGGAFENTRHQGVAGITAKDIWRFTTLSPSNNANLSDLVLSPGTLIPNFKDSIVDYQVNVAHDVESIDVTPTAANSSATLTLNGALITNGQLTTIPLNKGNNTITIVVTAENGVTKTYTLTVKRALPTLQQVGNVDLSTSGDATWTDITGESSYAVQLFKDGSPIGSVVDKAADSTTHNFLPAMRAAGAGAYTVTVSAKGDGFTYLDGAPSIPSNKQTMIKLASITNSLSWYGNIAKWPAIPNAVSYDVLLYKGGTVIGTAANVLAGNINEGVDFTTAFQTNGIGSYTFTVQPKGNELLILDGDQGVSSSAKIISPLTYTVLYNGNGSTSGTVPQDNATYSQNDNVIVAANEGHLVKTGHSFIGWNTKADGTGTSYLPNATFKIVSENITLFAQWVINHYTVRFDVAGGSAVSNQTVNHGEKASQPTTEPTKAGYTFGGWYKDAGHTQAYDFNSVITETMTIYAKWNAQTYTVGFNMDGGSAVPSQSVVHGEKASEPTPEPTKVGYTFGGWYKDADHTQAYDFNSVITETMTIYAKWNAQTYTVSFNTDGGSMVSSQSVAHGGKVSKPTSAPTKADYTFGGWYTSSTLEKLFDFDSSSITRNIIIYAKWVSIVSPPTSNDSSNSESSTPSTNTEHIVVDVEGEDGVNLTKTPIIRTTMPDGVIKDHVSMSEAIAKETIEKAKQLGNDTARIIIPDANDKVSEVVIDIPKSSLAQIHAGNIQLEIATMNAVISIPNVSMSNFSNDLYFRLVPIKSLEQQHQVEERILKEELIKDTLQSEKVNLIGRPMTIETNMQNRPVTLTLPLPKNITQEQLDNLAIFIEHSDGTKELIRGKVVDYQKDMLGLQFEVQKFSTFSILYLPEDENVEEPTTDHITHTPYIQGYADGTFRPNSSVTRAQMASMFARQLTGNAIPMSKATFTDTVQHDAKDAIEFVKEAGLFNGVTETSFHPNGFITRAQMAAIAARWMEKQCADSPNADFCKPTSLDKIFKDVSNNHWAVQAINTVNGLGIMTGITADTFNPDGYLTRAQAVKVLNRLFERQVTTEHQNPIFKDVPRKHWAFYEIQEAAKK
ncbi:InlB B-repeat-containing protein [Lysinibacillus sp. ZYM-1]|uniref:InlB B-repeat-containing protein n=1 Tax=Lysinibacillus sp. ZYM-1 TaxID=1681184 RepID=UPI0009EC7EF9|nr:InlB B-repeat-containing protein [Lysinibacillus sp. ZYM-1]